LKTSCLPTQRTTFALLLPLEKYSKVWNFFQPLELSRTAGFQPALLRIAGILPAPPSAFIIPYSTFAILVVRAEE
jgi:hypothetical protein